ncbi:hypothetical protein J0H58_18000, partial [bacterium]|nr:hypothetical protein [bacterium]
PVATGPAPADDGRWRSAYQAAYRDARRGGADAYSARASAVMALDASGYGAWAVAGFQSFGSRTNDRRLQQASIEAERAAARDPGVFARPSYPLAIRYSGTTRPVQAGTFGFAPEQSYGPPVDTNGVARAAESQAMLARLGMLARNPTTGAFPLYNRTDISPTAAPGVYGFAAPQAAGDRIPLASTGVSSNTYAVDARKRYRAESVGLVRNGFVGLNTSGAADLADARAYAGVRALGGPNLVSNQTALATQQAELARLEKELARAIDRQLRALTPAITATEARRKAEEQARLALEQNAAVLRNSKGQVVGTVANAQQLQAAGLAPGGAGWFSGATVRQRAGSFFGNLGRSFTPAGGMAGTYGLMFGAPVLAEQIGPSQQRIQAAAVTGNTTGTTAQGAAGTALTMAAMGAGVGMVFGPWGAAIGAAAGGLVGLAQGFSRTSKEIRDARVGQAVQHLGDMLTAAANNVRGGIGTLSPDNLRRQLGALNGEAGERAREVTNRSWWNPLRGRALSAMTAEEQAAVRTKENRAVFGGQAGAMVALLSREAEDLARKNPRARAADLGRRLGADPAAGQLVTAVAATRGVPVDQVLREFTESVRVAQRRIRVEEDLRRGRVAAERSAGAMSRLADAVSNAANSVARFETSMTVLGSVFSGSGGTGRVTPVGAGFAALGAGTGAEFRRSAGVLGEALGADGGLFLRRSEAADQLSRALPSVLATLGNTPVGPAGLSGKGVRDLLKDQLLPGLTEDQRKAALKDNPPLHDAIESAVAGVLRVQEESKDSGGLARRLQDDAGRVANEVAEAFAGPLKEMGQRMARDIEENANKFVDGLASARQMLVTAGESLDRAAELRLGAARAAADVTADRTGRSATDLLSLRDLQAPFIERQQRLTGLGADAENPAAIAARLRRVTGDIVAATSARDNAVGNRDRFSAAAGNLDRLVGVSNNLQAALRNLANASERAAGLQEKLNAATLNRDSRLGYVEKYTMSSPEEQARMQRGQQLVIGLDRGRANFNDLAPSEQQLALQSLNDFGQARLASGRTAEGLMRQLLGSVPGALDAGQENERRGLQDQLVGVFATAEQAQRGLAAFQQDTYTRFIADLKSLHEQFFARLAVNLAGEQLRSAQNSLATASVDRAGQQQELLQRDALVRLGVRDQAGLTALRGGQADVEAYFAADARFRALGTTPPVASDTRGALGSNLREVSDQLRGGLFSAPKTDKLEEVLRTRGLDQLSPEGRAEALRAVTERMRRYGDSLEGRGAWATLTPTQQLNILDNAVRNAMGRGQWVTQGQAMDERARAARNLEGRGVDVRALQGLSAADRSAVRSSLTGTLNLDTLDARVKDTTDAITRFRDQVQRAEEALRRATGNETGGSGALAGAVGPAGVLRRADGGFTPRGTDTVPAMLTPGEFVINRAATQANLPLLRAINAGKGAVQYHQEGGSIRRPSAPTVGQVADAYLWSVNKINQGLSWLGFASGGVVPSYLAGGGLAEQVDRARLAASLAENSRGAERGPLVGGGGGVIPALDAGQASYRAYLRRREAALARRLNPGAGPTSKVVAMTPAEALAANRALNTANMGFSQALARSGMDDGQVQAGLGSLAQRRDFEKHLFLDRFGASTAAMRMRDTQGWAAGAGVRRQNAAAQRRAEGAAMRWLGFGPRPTARYSLADRFVSPLGDRANSSFNVGRFADGGFVGGSGTGDTIP